MSKSKINIGKPEDILAMLHSGMTREDIKNHFHEQNPECIPLSNFDIKVIFSHPLLKNKKTIKPKEVAFVWGQEESSPENIKETIGKEEPSETIQEVEKVGEVVEESAEEPAKDWNAIANEVEKEEN